jgi:hypothetical protein
MRQTARFENTVRKSDQMSGVLTIEERMQVVEKDGLTISDSPACQAFN